MRIVSMIPVRVGSTRLRLKNLALLQGRPLVSYAIEAARAAGVFAEIVLNADHAAFRRIADRYGVEFYLRPAELGSSTTKSDAVVYDFMRAHQADAVAWVNPTSPLQTGDEIRAAVGYVLAEGLDSMITVKEERVHAVYEGKPVNFSVNEVFAQTQDLIPVLTFVYSVMMWRTTSFREAFERRGYALLSGRIGYFLVSKRSAVTIKTEDDLRIAQALLGEDPTAPIRYDPLADELVATFTAGGGNA